MSESKAEPVAAQPGPAEKPVAAKRESFVDRLRISPYTYIDPQCSCASEVRRECPREFNSAFFCHNRQVDLGRRNRVEPNVAVCKKEFSVLFRCMEKSGVDFNYEKGSLVKQ